MQFLCIYRPGTPERDGPPSQQEIESMGKLIDEMTRAGVLLTTGGCMASAKAFKVAIERPGKFTVTDGPFPETKELIAGYAIIQTKTKPEAVEWTKRFLSVTGEGETEVRQLHEQGPNP
jgi:hypothetical protein